MSDSTQLEPSTQAKICQLDELTKQAEKLDITVTVALATQRQATYRITAKGAQSYLSCERIGTKFHRFEKDMSIAMNNLIGDERVMAILALVVKATKSPMAAAPLRRLAIEAWSEAA
jgi:hypothetical protein